MAKGRKLGGCHLERVFSQSKHSELYRAFSEELQARVMIKVLASRYPPNSRTAQRFRRGGNLALELEHPNIVRTFASGEEKGRPYMILEYLEGHSLDRVLKVKKTIPWEVAAGIVRQVAKALDAADEKHIVHRSLDPSHIMLSPGGRATVLGFGMARLSEGQDAAITAEGALVNVNPYCPPETGQGVQDIRGDLYSLGCVFYHLISGNPPFEARDPLELLHKHRTEDYWPVADLVSGLPGQIADLMDMLLVKELERRLRTPAELIALVDAAISPELLGAQGVKPDSTMVASTMEMLVTRRKLTVLICDDQEHNLGALRTTLRRLGLNTLTTRDGQAAVETLTSREIHLLITDVKLPRLSGRQLLEAAAGARPGLAVILTRTGKLAESLYADKSFKIRACLGRPLDYFALRRTTQAVMEKILKK